MQVSRYIHACLLVEDDGDRILFDLSKVSFIEGLVKPDDSRDLSTIVPEGDGGQVLNDGWRRRGRSRARRGDGGS